MDDYERGYEQFRKMVGEDRVDEAAKRFKSVFPDFEKEVMSVVAGRVWARPGIDLKTRSLCSVAILAALGRTNGLRLNFEMALNNGATKEEIGEALLQVAVYAGFPAAWDAFDMLGEVLAEQS